MCEVCAVGKISDCQPGGPGFSCQPGRRPSFTTLSIERDVKLFVYSSEVTEMIFRRIKRSQTFLEKSRVVILVFGAAVRGATIFSLIS